MRSRSVDLVYLGLALLIALPLRAAAMSVTVTRSDDPTPTSMPDQCTKAPLDCSLRGAIETVEAVTELDRTVVIPPGTYPLTQGSILLYANPLSRPAASNRAARSTPKDTLAAIRCTDRERSTFSIALGLTIDAIFDSSTLIPHGTARSRYRTRGSNAADHRALSDTGVGAAAGSHRPPRRPSPFVSYRRTTTETCGTRLRSWMRMRASRASSPTWMPRS
jgi:hypothetical protein